MSVGSRRTNSVSHAIAWRSTEYQQRAVQIEDSGFRQFQALLVGARGSRTPVSIKRVLRQIPVEIRRAVVAPCSPGARFCLAACSRTLSRPTRSARSASTRLGQCATACRGAQRAHQWGACWLAGQLWRELQLDRFWADRLPPSHKKTRLDFGFSRPTGIAPGSGITPLHAGVPRRRRQSALSHRGRRPALRTLSYRPRHRV